MQPGDAARKRFDDVREFISGRDVGGVVDDLRAILACDDQRRRCVLQVCDVAEPHDRTALGTDRDREHFAERGLLRARIDHFDIGETLIRRLDLRCDVAAERGLHGLGRRSGAHVERLQGGAIKIDLHLRRGVGRTVLGARGSGRRFEGREDRRRIRRWIGPVAR